MPSSKGQLAGTHMLMQDENLNKVYAALFLTLMEIKGLILLKRL
jgi:hypothetical protein